MKKVIKEILKVIPDKPYLSMLYYYKMHKRINWNRPETFNEKLQWLKLYDRNPKYTMMVDKYEVKKYIAETIGEEYVVPTIGVWDRFDDINFDELPNQFVLKCTHDSGGLVICRDKATLDKNAAKAKIEQCLNQNYYYAFREWPYKNVVPRIIVEQYIEDEATKELRDYKLFCFQGQPKVLFVATDRQVLGEEVKFDFFDMDYSHIAVRNGHPNAKVYPQKPQQFNLMCELARRLSEGIPHVRVDFFEVNGRVYFGEMTFYHFSGMMPFEPAEWDKKMGEWIKLPVDE